LVDRVPGSCAPLKLLTSAAISVAVTVFAIGILLSAPSPVHAGWFTKLLREAGEGAVHSGGRAVRKGVSTSFDDVARFVAKLPASAKKGSGALALEVTQEGHWRFANRAGEVVTAGTPDELKRAVALLAPSGAKVDGGSRRVSFYLSQDSIFKHRDLLKDLPPHKDLFIVAGRKSYPLRIKAGRQAGGAAGGAAGPQIFVKFNPHIQMKLTSRAAFKEAIWQMARPLNRSAIRLLSFQPGARRFVPTAPRLDKASSAVLPDIVDPHALLTSMATMRGQTAIVQGRINGKYLFFKPESGSEGAVKLERLYQAAAREDVNLILLHTSSGAQPGARNWLWLRVGVERLDLALRQKSYGGFLSALAPAKTNMTLVLRQSAASRVSLSASPADRLAGSSGTTSISDQWSDAVSSITGNIVQLGVGLSLRSKERQRELDLRIIPGIPSMVQFLYILLFVMGLMALGVARRWWRRIWPLEKMAEYGTRIGFFAARGIRSGMFLLVFLPLSAPVSLPVHFLQYLWHILTMPLRLWRWLRGGFNAGT